MSSGLQFLIRTAVLSNQIFVGLLQRFPHRRRYTPGSTSNCEIILLLHGTQPINDSNLHLLVYHGCVLHHLWDQRVTQVRLQELLLIHVEYSRLPNTPGIQILLAIKKNYIIILDYLAVLPRISLQHMAYLQGQVGNPQGHDSVDLPEPGCSVFLEHHLRRHDGHLGLSRVD